MRIFSVATLASLHAAVQGLLLEGTLDLTRGSKEYHGKKWYFYSNLANDDSLASQVNDYETANVFIKGAYA